MIEDKGALISQCMIVKNEEGNIEKALSWGKGLVWEQIVVDTGSTDRTVEIARSMGAAVYHFSWIDDFAAAKNFAISKAKGQWIAFLDADETFAQGDEKKLPGILEHLESSQAEAVTTGWMQLDKDGTIAVAGTQIRIFRNLPGLGYRRRIHEQLGWLDNTPMHVADATKELSILHTGYTGDAWEEKKVNNRNLKLIRKELEDHPGDHEMLGYLGDEYYGNGDMEEAEKCYREAIASMPNLLDGRDQRSAATFLYLLMIMDRNQVDTADMLSVYKKAAVLLPEEADFDYIMGMHYRHRESYGDGGLYLERAVGKLERYGCYNRAMLLTGHLQEAYEQLALCCLMVGDKDKAVRFSVVVLKSQPYSMQALRILLQAFRGNENHAFVSPENAADFLGKLYHLDHLKDRLFVLRAVRDMGWKELEHLVEKWFPMEELEYIKKSMGRSTSGEEEQCAAVPVHDCKK